MTLSETYIANRDNLMKARNELLCSLAQSTSEFYALLEYEQEVHSADDWMDLFVELLVEHASAISLNENAEE